MTAAQKALMIMLMIAMSAVAFSSSSGEDVIARAIDVLTDDVLDPLTQAFDEFYEVTRTVNEITDGGFKRVSCQTCHISSLCTCGIDRLRFSSQTSSSNTLFP